MTRSLCEGKYQQVMHLMNSCFANLALCPLIWSVFGGKNARGHF